MALGGGAKAGVQSFFIGTLHRHAFVAIRGRVARMAPKASPPVIDPLSIPRLQLVLTLKDIKHKAGTRLRIDIVHPTWVAKVFMSDTASERVEQIIAAAPEIKVSDITDEFAIALHGAKAGQPHMRPATAPVPVTMPPEVAAQPQQSPRQTAGTPEAPFMHSEHSVRDDYKSRNLGSRNCAVRDVSYSDAVAGFDSQMGRPSGQTSTTRRKVRQPLADARTRPLPMHCSRTDSVCPFHCCRLLSRGEFRVRRLSVVQAKRACFVCCEQIDL